MATAAVVAASWLGVPAAGAATPTGDGTPAGYVSVFEMSGLLDPVLVNAVGQAVREAEAGKAKALVLQANSGGVVVSDATYARLLNLIKGSSVPVDVWIGPSGSHLTGPSAQLLGVAREVGMAPGTSVGNSGEPVPGVELSTDRLPLVLRDRTVGSAAATKLGVTTTVAPTLGDFVVRLPGVETRTVEIGNERRLEPVTQVQFSQLSLLDQLFHTVASPAVAYLLFAIGMALLIFDLFTAGVGVAGVVGAFSFILACYGLDVLPIHLWAAALLVVSMAAFAVDVQTGVPRFWTAAGGVLFVVGSLTLYDGVSLSWITLAVAFVGVALTFLMAMPAMVRTRFSTPTIGREWMIGEMGRAVTDLAPDGTVQIRDALWRAYTNRATPIGQLDRVRVVGIEGLVLEVEPEEGGARDYRSRG
ncbi:MAG TPA: NfeD family protein [Acidimicrobiales bacterium]|nr:NfeD family protein [Acidimicrobiales bacterium]